MDKKKTVEFSSRRLTREIPSANEKEKDGSQKEAECRKGICTISWKPVKPAA